MTSLNKLLFEPRPQLLLELYRIFFPIGVLLDLYLFRNHFLKQVLRPDCQPLPIFELTGWPLIMGGWATYPFLALVLSLLSLSLGFYSRFSAGLAAILFFWVVGSDISCVVGADPIYVPYNHSIVIFNLLVLSMAPVGRQLSLDVYWRKKRTQNLLENWPLFLLKFNLIFAYFSSVFPKLRAGGLDWANGYTLQTYLMVRHMNLETPLVIPLIENWSLLVVMSVVVMLSEFLSPLALVCRNFAILFVLGSLLMQTAFFVVTELRWMHFFGWSYLVYIIEALFFLYLYLNSRWRFVATEMK